jgi:Tol biopolymer transport system component
MEGHERKLSSGWTSMEGIAWSPDGDEIWFTATKIGSSLNLRGVTLSGKLRTIATVPGGMVLQDVRNGVALFVTQQDHHGIRGISPGGKEERELGWFGWSVLRDISRDGTKVLFEEEGEGGGPNYSVFLRDTDGSPPLRMGEGRGQTISPDGKWVITQTPQGGSLNLVPTGVGEARQLTHDKISYGRATYLPDGKYVMASGIEEGHGARSYLVDVSTGNAKPVTPDGVAGTLVSPDGRFLAVTGPDKKWAIWPLDGTGLRPIPGLGSEFQLTGWSPDGSSLYAVAHLRLQPKAKVYRVNVNTGKMEYWKTLGVDSPSGISSLVRVLVSADGSAYAYGYGQRTSEVYLVRGLR